MNVKLLSEVECFCAQHYDEATLKHAYRVKNHMINSPLFDHLSSDEQYLACIVALFHDIIKTNFDDMSIRSSVTRLICPETNKYTALANNALHRLTQHPEEDYIHYIKRLRECDKSMGFYNSIAYIIKLADIKDHLMQKDTLTDKLKRKYWNALPYLL